MSDVLIRDVPDDVMVVIDGRAARLRLSRNEYLRRRLRQDARHHAAPVEVGDLRRLQSLFADLANPEVMGRAWS